MASNPKQKALSEVAQTLSEQQLVKLRACRDEVVKRHGDFINQFTHAEDLTMNQHQSESHQVQTLSPDDKKYTPQTVMLIKLFHACDAYFNTLYFAHINGELTHQECSVLRQETMKTLRSLLALMVKSSMEFHKMKKQIKGVS
ncbi:hypothetical protein JCM19233_5561 [Vibrio astriarenae]|nr:hypothetical protein JCM19233_5561 [Vibrio sp. C7]